MRSTGLLNGCAVLSRQGEGDGRSSPEGTDAARA